MSGSIFERERLRPTAAPSQVAAVAPRVNETAAPVRPSAPRAPETPFFGPRPPQQGASNLQQIATALSGLSPVLMRHAESYAEGVRKEDGQSAEADATEAAMQRRVSTWAEAVRQNPALADRSPFYRQIYEERLARSSVQREGNALHATYWSSPLAGSADPAAIQEWMGDKMKALLEQFRDSPAQRAAAAEEVRTQAQSLVRTHQQNAARNLVQQNEDAFSAAVGSAFDTHYTRGGSGQTDTANLDPKLRAIYERVGREEGIPAEFLMAQGQRESGFRPEVIDGRVRSSAGAIGIGQVLPSTARDPGFGVAPISEADLLDPDKAIRFQAKYLRARGAALGVRDWTDPRQVGKALAAYGGPGEEARGYSAGILANAASFRGGTSGPNTGNSTGAGLGAELQRLEAEARAQGVDGRRVNALMTEALTTAMVRHVREDYAALGLIPRPDGTPGFAATGAGRAAIEQARASILSRSVQEENRAFTRTMRARQEAGDALSGDIARTLIDQLANGQDPTLTPDQLRLAARINPDLIGTVTGLRDKLRGIRQDEDAAVVAPIEYAAATGQMTPDQVLSHVGRGLNNQSTITRILRSSMEAQSGDNVFRNPMVQDLIRQTSEAASGFLEGTGILKNYGLAVAVSNAMREEASSFMQRHPQAPQGELLAHLTKRQAELVQRFNPDVNLPGYESRARPGAEGERAADPRQVQRTAPIIQPNPSVNWRRVPVFRSAAELETDYTRWRESQGADTATSMFRWIEQGGITNPQTFYEVQRRLLQQSPNRNSTQQR